MIVTHAKVRDQFAAEQIPIRFRFFPRQARVIVLSPESYFAFFAAERVM